MTPGHSISTLKFSFIRPVKPDDLKDKLADLGFYISADRKLLPLKAVSIVAR